MNSVNPILASSSKRIKYAFLLFISCAAPILAVPNPFYVTTVADAPIAPPGSLRDAINHVNAGSNNAIYFNIPISDGYDPSTNTWTIQPTTDLPNIMNTVLIDGYTQPYGSPVAHPNTLANGDDAVLTIVLNGSLTLMTYDVNNFPITGNGLHFAPLSSTSVDNSVVRGLVINQWLDNAILLDTTNANITGVSIVGNFIGSDASGTIPMPNRAGIGLSGVVNTGNTCFNTLIGTSTLTGTPAYADRNIIGASFGCQLFYDTYGLTGGSVVSYGNVGTVITNNYIGTDKNGTKALGFSSWGIQLNSETNSLVGGSSANQRNIISGQNVAGLLLVGANNCLIQGNYIGTDFSGTYAVSNLNAGITFEGPNTVGCSVIGNLISGNGQEFI